MSLRGVVVQELVRSVPGCFDIEEKHAEMIDIVQTPPARDRCGNETTVLGQKDALGRSHGFPYPFQASIVIAGKQVVGPRVRRRPPRHGIAGVCRDGGAGQDEIDIFIADADIRDARGHGNTAHGKRGAEVFDP